MASSTSQNYYEHYWTDETQAIRSAVYRTDHGFLTPDLQSLLEAHIPVGTALLDVGCGDARTLGVWAAETGRHYTGVDISAEAVKRAQSIGLDVRQISDATQLPFDNDSVDVVTCIEVLEHVFLPQQVAAEILRVLKPNGIFIATTPNVAFWRDRVNLALLGRWDPLGDDLSVQQPWRDPHIRFFAVRTLQRMLQQVGFRSVTMGGHEGSVLGYTPVLKRWYHLENRKLYHRLEMLAPSLFARRLAAVARK
jgi:methionine biosynthesis protein MetW